MADSQQTAPAGRLPPAFAFKVASTPLQHGPLGIVRSLGRMGVRVHSNFERRWAPVRFSRYAAEGVVWRRWPGSAQEALERLVVWAERHEGERPVLIPTDDAAAVAVAEQRELLQRYFVFPRQEPDLPRLLSDKLALAQRCEALGVPTPRTVTPRDRREVEELAAELAFPVVVKRIANRSQVDYDDASVRLVADAARLRRLWDELESRGSAGNHLLQEFIPGGSEDVWMFDGYFDDRSRCLLGYTGVKIRQYPSGRGWTTLGECRRNDTVVELAVRLLEGVGYRGPVDMGFRYDRRDGRYKLLDVNPRIGATFRLFVSPSGADVARAMYLDLTGQPVPSDHPPDGRRWLVEPWDVRTSLGDGSAVRRWPSSLRGVRELAWFAADDPAPAAMMAAWLAVGVVGTASRSARRSGG